MIPLWKRAFDILAAAAAAFVLAPVLMAVGALVWLTSGRPILLAQERVGANEGRIRVFKFRTMRRDTPLVAKSLLGPADRAYTPVGPFLRRWSLDELPQLFNVLRGEMSIVGPRPALPTQHDLLALRRKTAVVTQRPGLTGLAQVKGRESLTIATKVRLESLYARKQSPCLDARIVLWTFSTLLGGRGAY